MMKVEDLNNFTRVISYNDDNHGIRIYINGRFVDSMDNGIEAAVNLLVAGQDSVRANSIVTTDVYLPDVEGTDEVVDRVHDILCQAPTLTAEQEVAIINQTYEKI